jgi:tetratricopeptide (TPR) repeat protein
MRSLAVGLASFLLFVASARAATDPRVEEARAHVKAAIAFYDDGRYEEAAREMEAAYAIKPLADLQYNLAQCYERLARLPEAVEAYKRYLAGRPDADDHEMIQARVKNLSERIAAGKKDQVPPPPVEKVVLKEVIVYREAPPKPGRGARFAAYGLGVLSLGALGAGVAFALLAKQNADAVTSGGNPALPVPFDGRLADAQDAGHTDRIVAWVGFGAAVVCAAGAVGLWALGRHIDKEATKVAVVPSVAPGGGGLALAGSF